MHPVFIVGSVRTGSTLLINAIREAGYAGEGEGHFCHLFFLMRRCIDDYYEKFSEYAVKGTTLYWISHEEIAEEYKAFVQGFMRKKYHDRPWVEKTVNIESLISATCYQELWPSSRFIFSKRRPMENIISRSKKFPEYSFEYHVKDIKQIFSEWSTIRSKLREKIEVDQYDIVVSPEETAQRVAGLLNSPGESASRIADVLRNTFPQRTSESYEPADFDDLDWTRTMKSYFVDELDGVMQEYGYAYGSSYWS